MTITERTQNNITVLRLEGDVMGGPEASTLNEEINRLLDEGKLQVVIDLEPVKRMNSSGLAILINAMGTYKQNGGQLKLAAPGSLVHNLLKVTRLDSYFEIYDSVDAAVTSF
ncbi:MAG: anti-sigma factor antagonist [Calditrichaeota bacterium]|nr:MAG: anti-sigma factor antagonist [Calditrichota bacterium]